MPGRRPGGRGDHLLEPAGRVQVVTGPDEDRRRNLAVAAVQALPDRGDQAVIRGLVVALRLARLLPADQAAALVTARAWQLTTAAAARWPRLTTISCNQPNSVTRRVIIRADVRRPLT